MTHLEACVLCSIGGTLLTDADFLSAWMFSGIKSAAEIQSMHDLAVLAGALVGRRCSSSASYCMPAYVWAQPCTALRNSQGRAPCTLLYGGIRL